MIISVSEAREIITTTESDAVLELRIQALESAIRKYTNNQFKDGFPPDVKLGAINMLKWDIESRDKVGIQSETISRHSVTYFNMDGDNSALGYPKSLTGFLKPYRKAQF